MEATWRYSGDLKAKSTSKVSHVVCGVGPSLRHMCEGVVHRAHKSMHALPWSGLCPALLQPHASLHRPPQQQHRRLPPSTCHPQQQHHHCLPPSTCHPTHLNSHLLVRWEKREESSTRECTAVGHCSVTLDV